MSISDSYIGGTLNLYNLDLELVKTEQVNSDERFEKSAAILEDFHKEYYDMPVWTDIISTIYHALKTHDRHLEDPPPFGLKEAVAVLIKQYDFDTVSDEILGHNT